MNFEMFLLIELKHTNVNNEIGSSINKKKTCQFCFNALPWTSQFHKTFINIFYLISTSLKNLNVLCVDFSNTVHGMRLFLKLPLISPPPEKKKASQEAWHKSNPSDEMPFLVLKEKGLFSLHLKAAE